MLEHPLLLINVLASEVRNCLVSIMLWLIKILNIIVPNSNFICTIFQANCCKKLVYYKNDTFWLFTFIFISYTKIICFYFSNCCIVKYTLYETTYSLIILYHIQRMSSLIQWTFYNAAIQKLKTDNFSK